jgi:hypothetical protein
VPLPAPSMQVSERYAIVAGRELAFGIAAVKGARPQAPSGCGRER